MRQFSYLLFAVLAVTQVEASDASLGTNATESVVTNTDTIPSASGEGAILSPDWHLVWADEFGSPGPPDPRKWGYETGMVRNNEAQLYTPDRPENARVEQGCLVIEARKETMDVPGEKAGTARYTSASLQTKDRVDWLYGRIEARAKVPRGRGTWPAIWMMPTDRTAGWPACGEIDIIEYVGFMPETIHGTVHTLDYNHLKKNQRGAKLTSPNLEDDFHVYAIEWDPRQIRFFFDGKLYFTYENDGQGKDTWPFDKPFYLKINSAIGGTWGGKQGIDDSIFPQTFLIDYVRVYQETPKSRHLGEK